MSQRSNPNEPTDPTTRRRPLTAQDLLDSALVGMWADRSDIADSSEQARTLRRQLATRVFQA